MEHRGRSGLLEGRWDGKGKCWPGVGRGRDSNVERPANRRAGVGEGVGTVGSQGPPPIGMPLLTHSGLRGGWAGCRPRGGFFLQGGPGRGEEVSLPSFPGTARPGPMCSFLR